MSKEYSPYWAWVAKHSKYDSNGNAYESTDANPDHLSEDDVLIKRSELSDEDEEKLADYYKLISKGLLKKLSPRQQTIWKLRFFRWCSEKEIGLELGLNIKTIRKHLELAAEKIRVEIEKQQKCKDRLDGNYFKDGFKKKVHTEGVSNTDKDFAERLERGEKEIDDFCRKHPELRRDV